MAGVWSSGASRVTDEEVCGGEQRCFPACGSRGLADAVADGRGCREEGDVNLAVIGCWGVRQEVPNLSSFGAGLSGFYLEGDELGEFGGFDDGE